MIFKKQKKSWKQRNGGFSCPHNSPRKRTKGGKKNILLAIPITLLAFFVYIFAFSNLFAINVVEISGNNKTDTNEIRSLAIDIMKQNGKYYINGNNYFIADEDKIAQKLVEKFTQIKSIKIDKNFPNKLIINVEEKESALIWCRNKCFFMNSQGVAFMEANEEQLVKENQSFIKIQEEAKIEEENEQEGVLTQKIAEAEEKDGVQTEEQINESQTLLAINANDKISDENFINFTIDINEKLSYNKRLKVKFYKTKGTKTRELIAFTDKNTRIYFDTTKDLEIQIKNLNYFLNKELEQSQIDNLQYIYLKNQDRIFYK